MTGPARQPVSGGGFAALIAGRAARAYGAAPPASRLLRIADATALRAGPDPGASAAPRAGDTGRPGLPRPARGPPRDQHPAPAAPATRTEAHQLIPYPIDQRFP